MARDTEGFQDLDREACRSTDDTIYHWASITKTFTGIAIMQLRDRGLLSLDDPVVKYVPELALAHDPFGNIADIKIRHMMSHSAGFRAATWPWGGDQPWHPFEPTDLGAAGRDAAVHGRAVRARHEVQLFESRRDLPRANHRAACPATTTRFTSPRTS